MDEAWRDDEFALDPTRVTLHIGATGMDGDTFRKMLIERFDIQINKTSRNTVLVHAQHRHHARRDRLSARSADPDRQEIDEKMPKSGSRSSADRTKTRSRR